LPRTSKSDPSDAPWPFDGAIVFEERGGGKHAGEGQPAFHVVDRWCYLGHAPSASDAHALLAGDAPRGFELSTYRILQTHLARGLRVMPAGLSAALPAGLPQSLQAVDMPGSLELSNPPLSPESSRSLQSPDLSSAPPLGEATSAACGFAALLRPYFCCFLDHATGFWPFRPLRS